VGAKANVVQRGQVAQSGGNRSNSISLRNGGSHNNSPHSNSNSLHNGLNTLLTDINGGGTHLQQTTSASTTGALPQFISTSLNGNASSMSNVFAPSASTNPLLQQQQQQQQRSGSNVANAQQLQYALPTQQQMSATSAGGSSGLYALAPNQYMVAVNQQQSSQHGHSAHTPAGQQPTYYAYPAAGGHANRMQVAVAASSGQQGQTQYMTYPQHTYGAASYYVAQNGNGGYVIHQGQPTGSQPGTSYVMDNRTGSIYAAIPATTSYAGNPQQLHGSQLQAQYVAAVPQQLVQTANGSVMLTHPQSTATSPQAQGTMSTPPNVSVTEKNGNAADGNVGSGSMALPVLKDSGKSDAK